jgi:hypothetical protein
MNSRRRISLSSPQSTTYRSRVAWERSDRQASDIDFRIAGDHKSQTGRLLFLAA